MIFADIGLGEVLWSLLTIFFMVVYFMMLFSVVVDLFRDHELGGVAKALWLLFLLVFPLIALLVYVITRGDKMARRSAARAQAAESDFQAYVRDAAGGTPADQIARAKALLDDGTISSEEFEALKRKALT
jgi:ABC-type multidrug transport system fused ATPase/permease subunit